MKRALCFLGISSAFLRGYGSVIDIFGVSSSASKAKSKNEDSVRLANDWKKVGESMNWSIKEYDATTKRLRQGA